MSFSQIGSLYVADVGYINRTAPGSPKDMPCNSPTWQYSLSITFPVLDGREARDALDAPLRTVHLRSIQPVAAPDVRFSFQVT